MSSNAPARLAADIGGTFTDVVLESGGRSFTAKVLTTHHAPEQGVIEGIASVLKAGGVQPRSVSAVIHGTTLAANAIIERRGARTALLVTQGHRDALETGYEDRFDQYDLALEKPRPLVPRRWRLPVAERMAASGQVLLPLDESSVARVIETLRAESIESVAIGLLHSYANPSHEQRVAELLREAMPDLWISLSSEVSPQIREYERLSTTAANAYVQPVMAGYMRDLERRLAEEGFRCPLLLVMSTGGLTTVDVAARFPVRLVESGPAGGAILASHVARGAGIEQVIAFDMGGTTAKLCLIDQGTPQRSDTFEVDRVHRFIRGSGLPLRIPTIEVVEIGTGGGSIANIDALGRLRMGPRSAGSDPGPACYGRGGEHATVTDANVVLRRIDGAGFAGGLFDLQPELARRAIAEQVGTPLQMEIGSAAVGMCEIADEAMANAARVHAIESGKDLSSRTLIAFGGAAPLHAGRVAEKLGISRVMIPADAGVGSAVGFLLAPVSFEVTRSWVIDIDELTKPAVAEAIRSMQREASAIVMGATSSNRLRTELRAHLRYSAQAHEIEVSLPVEPLADTAAFRAAFEARYLALYGRLIPGVQIRLVSLALRVTAEDDVPSQAERREVAPTRVAAGSHRDVTRPDGSGTEAIATYARVDLPPGASFDGPAIVVERQTTTVVPHSMRAHIDAWGNVVMTRKEAA